MRPKKSILIVSQCEELCSNLAFKLGVNRYLPFSVNSESEALALLTTRYFDLMILTLPLPDAKQFLDCVRKLDKNMRSLVLVERGATVPSALVADAVMTHYEGAFSLILERVGLLTKRKHGPKKGFKRLPASDSIPVSVFKKEAVA